jgi:hypothetical protein
MRVRDHWRILGTLFMAWAVAQAVSAVIALAVTGREATAQMTGGQWALVIGITVLSVLAYFWVGSRLRVHDVRARVAGILLSFLALLSFPVGTLVGAYGLFVLFKYRYPRAQQA